MMEHPIRLRSIVDCFLARLSGRGHFHRVAAALAVLALAVGCGDPRDQFLAGRVMDPCDSQWPVCDRIAGCLIGERSYLEGRFPGEGRVAVQLFEPSTVKVSLFLEEVTGAGEETVIHFYEEGCRTRVREAVSGRSLVGEAEQVGFFSREADLTGEGDHLIELTSDARARYLLKVEVVPKRLQP